MSEEERIKRDIQLGKEMHTVACQTCGATVGWVRGNRYRREVESKREALKKVAALEAERDKLRELIKGMGNGWTDDCIDNALNHLIGLE